MNPRVSALLIVWIALVGYQNVAGVAVMSVDLGTEWMKIGVVSPGVPMEIVLNRESKRKTPVAVAFRDGERLIGEDAMNIGVRFPKNNYFYLLELLGKSVDHPLVKKFQEKFPYYDIFPDPETGTVVFRHDDETTFKVEELLAMIIARAKEFAEEFTDQTVKDVVMVVPVYFNQAERRAMLRVVELAGLKLLQLINDNTAVALNYGIFRRKHFNETAQKIMFFDMGATSTVASIVGYQIVKTKERGFTETHPQLSMLGVGFDRTLGGLEMQVRLRDHLGKIFNEQKKTSMDVFKNARAMAKLFKEAGRLKSVLSANVDHVSQVEGLLDDQDFRAKVTRAELEELCSDLFDRVRAPIDMALQNSGLTLADIDQLILVGAGTRVPKVQEKIQEIYNIELGKSLNTDEAAAMGAVYKAADLGTGFKVKKFITKDAVLYPIQVDFQRETENEDGKKTIRSVRRALFPPMNLYPQKKVMTFNRHTEDFLFNVNHGDLEKLPKPEIGYLATYNLTEVSIKGVSEAIQKHSGENTESKGIKAHFNLDGNGILVLTHTEAVFEKMVMQAENSTKEESAFSKLGSTISKLFSSGDSEEKENPATEESSEGEEKKEEGNKEEKTESKEEKKPANDTTSANKTEEVKPKQVTLREPLIVEEKRLDVADPSKESDEKSLKKIKDLDEADRIKREKEAARNNLEGFCTDVQDKLWQEDYEKASTDEEREKIRSKCSELTDWLYEEGMDVEASIYDGKLKEVKAMTEDLWKRVREHLDRPEALQALKDMTNHSEVFLKKAKESKEGFFTDVEISTLEKLINETNKWKKEKVAEQEATPLTKTPVLTMRMIAEKIAAMDREIKYLVNKAQSKAYAKREEERKNKTKAANTTSEEAKPGEGKSEDKQEETKDKPDGTKEEKPDGGTGEESKEKTESQKDSKEEKKEKEHVIFKDEPSTEAPSLDEEPEKSEHVEL